MTERAAASGPASWRSRFVIGETAAVALLAVLAALYLSWPLYRLFIPLEIDRNEAWNAWHALSALGARPLYPSANELIINNYPPLYFYIVGWAGELMGDIIFAGRVISILSVLALGAIATAMVRQLDGRPLPALFAGVWLVATLSRSFWDYTGMNDPNLLALAIMCAGFLWYVARLDAGRSVVPALAVMVAAGFVKHNIIAFPIVALIWHATIDKRGALKAAVIGAVMGAAGLALCHWLYGPAFLQQLLLPRQASVLRAIRHLGRLQYVIIAIVLWATWAWPNRTSKAARLTGLMIIASLASYVLQKLSPGVDVNAQFELVFATAVGIGVAASALIQHPAVERFPIEHVRAVALALLVARLVLHSNFEPYQALFSPAYRQQVEARIATLNSEIAAVKAIAGNVDCTVMTVCFRAGKPFVHDGFGTGMRRGTRHLDEQTYKRLFAELAMQRRISDPRLIWRDPRAKPIAVYNVTVQATP